MIEQPTCFLSPKLQGRVRPDGSHGVFARRLVRPGEMLAVWGGEVRSGAQLARLSPELRRYSLQVEEDLYVVSYRQGPADWINHSCEPNAGMCGQVVLTAMRDIPPGEEICYDYSMTDGSSYDEFQCGCGTPSCRGRVSGDDWRLPYLWERYAGYFAPYLQRRIDRMQKVAANMGSALAVGAGLAAPRSVGRRGPRRLQV